MRHNTAAVALAVTIAIVALASALMMGCASPPSAASQVVAAQMKAVEALAAMSWAMAGQPSSRSSRT